MRLVVLLAALCLLPAAQAATREERWTVTAPSGTEIALRLRRPEQDGRQPALILLGGLRRGAQAVDLVPPELPLLVVGLDYPLQLPRKPAWTEWPGLALQIRRSIPDTRAAVTAVYHALKARPDVDPDRIILAGVSLGAPFAVLAGADEPIPVLILVHGFARLPLTLEHQFAPRFERRYGQAGRPLAWLAARVLDLAVGLPDIEAAARRLRAGQRVLVINAEADRRVPRAAHESLWQALAESPAQVQTHLEPGDHIRPSDAQTLSRLLGLSLDWLQREGILGSAISETDR